MGNARGCEQQENEKHDGSHACYSIFIHYHADRNHQGVGNRLLQPFATVSSTDETINCHERLGGMLNFYYREAA
jgi:hypothetical protein